MGGLHGAVAWGTYFIVENVLFTLVPLVGGLNGMMAPTQWRVFAILAVAFPCQGFVLGGLASLASWALGALHLARKTPSTAHRYRALATLTLIAAFITNLLTVRPLGSAGAFALVVSAALAVGSLSAFTSERWRRRIGVLTNPWAASAVMLAGGWAAQQVLPGVPLLMKLAGAILAVLAVAATAMAGSRLWLRWSLPRDLLLPKRAAAGLLMATAVVAASSLLLSRGLASLRPLQFAAAASRPSVVVVTMDAVRADHLSVYGYPRDTTPVLRQFAKTATLYTNAIAPADWTLPSHASLFTGLYASWHGSYFDPPKYVAGRPLGRQYPTLASILADNGYRTIAVAANWGGLNPIFGLDRGFQLFDARMPRTIMDPRLLRRAVREELGAFIPCDDFDARFRRAEEIDDTIPVLLERVAREQAPFLLFVNYMDAHVPYVPPPPFSGYRPGQAQPIGYYEYRAIENQVMTRTRSITPAEKDQLLSQYDGGIRYIDSRLTPLFRRLKELGLFDNTMIVIASDHGEAFGEHGLMQHMVSVYQDQVHVPLIIKYPRQTTPRVVDDLVSLVDVLPTALSALGFEPPKVTQGEDLQDPGKRAGRLVVAESFSQPEKFGHRLDRVERAIFLAKAKFITSTTGKRELYDTSLDPKELHNLYAEDTPEATTLEKRLAEWVARIPPKVGGTPKDRKDILKVLRSLGYMQ